MEEIFVCNSDELAERGAGRRFPLTAGGEDATGFVIRHGGEVFGYLNRCAHIPLELDWNEGDFFDFTRSYIMCATHGAIYHPANGRCAGGPCRGSGLRPIIVTERDNRVFWQPDDYVRPATA